MAPKFLNSSAVWRIVVRMCEAAYNANPGDRVGVVYDIMLADLSPHLHSDTPERVANTALRLVAFMLTHDKHVGKDG